MVSGAIPVRNKTPSSLAIHLIMARRALLIGIDNYPMAPLQGCVRDALRIESILERNDDFSRNFDCKVLISRDQEVTRDRVNSALDQLLAEGTESALLYYSGHGAQNIIGGHLVTQDYTQNSPGIPFNEIIQRANNSHVPEIVIIADCCYSGNLGNTPGMHDQVLHLREGISILTSSMPDQLSKETREGGEFTSILVSALEGECADIFGHVTLSGIYHHVDFLFTSWQQRPMFKSHVSRMTPLRKCKSRIELKKLYRLLEYFPDTEHEYQLDEEHEHTSPRAIPRKVTYFQDLQSFRDLGMVYPVGAPSLYDAAMNEKKCTLTPTGRFYWKLLKKGVA